jgi:hypothetical protein
MTILMQQILILIRYRLTNVGISFVLEIRKATTKTSWGTRDVMKQTKRGGLDPFHPLLNLIFGHVPLAVEY